MKPREVWSPFEPRTTLPLGNEARFAGHLCFLNCFDDLDFDGFLEFGPDFGFNTLEFVPDLGLTRGDI